MLDYKKMSVYNVCAVLKTYFNLIRGRRKNEGTIKKISKGYMADKK